MSGSGAVLRPQRRANHRGRPWQETRAARDQQMEFMRQSDVLDDKIFALIDAMELVSLFLLVIALQFLREGRRFVSPSFDRHLVEQLFG